MLLTFTVLLEDSVVVASQQTARHMREVVASLALGILAMYAFANVGSQSSVNSMRRSSKARNLLYIVGPAAVAAPVATVGAEEPALPSLVLVQGGTRGALSRCHP